MNQKELESWVDGIYNAERDELDCLGLQAVLPAYIDAELTSQPFDPFVTRKVRTHLQQCPDCREVHDGLKYVVQQELTDEMAFAPGTAVPSESPIPDMTAAPPR